MSTFTDARAEMAAAIDYFEGRRMYRAMRAMRRSLNAVTELVEAIEERRRMSSARGHSTGPFAVSDARIDVAIAAVQGVIPAKPAPESEPNPARCTATADMFGGDAAGITTPRTA